MKMKKMLICLLALAMLVGCAPAVEGGDATQSTPVVSPTAVPDPTETPEPTPTPEPTDTEEDAKFTFWVEGVENTVSARKHNSLMGYSMVYDHNMLTFEKQDGCDLYAVKEETNLPAVQIKITKENRTVSDIVSNLKKSGADDYGYRRLGGCETRVLHFIEGNDFDDVVKDFYVVQAGKAVYLIESSYFFEAAEGSGMRMAQMIETIRFADVPAPTELKIMFRNKEMKDFTSVVGDVTALWAGTDAGAACTDVTWTSSDEEVFTVVADGANCDVVIEGEGVAKLTVTCGDLSASTVVRAKKRW